MNETAGLRSKAGDLREAFDLTFASLPPPLEEVDDILTIRVAGDPYAIRLSEMAGLIEGRKVVPILSVTADLLGLAGIRGGLVPVFGLASILGCRQAPGSPRWMILCGVEEPIALAFADFENYLRVPKSSSHEDGNPSATSRYVRQAVSIQGIVRAVIAIPAIVAAIRSRIGH
jgi:purine-binding chemotaxis protein CheW